MDFPDAILSAVATLRKAQRREADSADVIAALGRLSSKMLHDEMVLGWCSDQLSGETVHTLAGDIREARKWGGWADLIRAYRSAELKLRPLSEAIRRELELVG